MKLATPIRFNDSVDLAPFENCIIYYFNRRGYDDVIQGQWDSYNRRFNIRQLDLALGEVDYIIPLSRVNWQFKVGADEIEEEALYVIRYWTWTPPPKALGDPPKERYMTTSLAGWIPDSGLLVLDHPTLPERVFPSDVEYIIEIPRYYKEPQ